MSAGVTKNDIRAQMQRRRAGLDPAWCAEQSALIQARLMGVPAVVSASVVGLYMALPGEVEMADFGDGLVSTGREICVPAFDAARGVYALALVSSETTFMTAPLGLREPEDPVWADPETLSCVVVPGVAFDEAGHRVGHGGGHYDRMLTATSAIKIGVAFDVQMVERLPAEEHDVPMDVVVTPTRVIRRTEDGVE